MTGYVTSRGHQLPTKKRGIENPLSFNMWHAPTLAIPGGPRGRRSLVVRDSHRGNSLADEDRQTRTLRESPQRH